jgi:hypothetical protein
MRTTGNGVGKLPKGVLTLFSWACEVLVKGLFTQQPQVSDLTGRENQVLGGQAATTNPPKEAAANPNCKYQIKPSTLHPPVSSTPSNTSPYPRQASPALR